MRLYWSIVSFNLLRYLEYPLEIAAILIRRFTELGLLLLFWSIAAQSSGGKIQVVSLLSYFLIAAAVAEITMSRDLIFAKQLRNFVRDGQLNNYLIKPVKILPYLYADLIGRSGVRLSFASISLGIGIFLNPPQTFFAILLFLFTLGIAVFISLGLNIILGSLVFVTTEINGFKNTMAHIVRVMSGMLVPINFFPPFLKTWSAILPFQAMVYAPTKALEQSSIDWIGLILAMVWAAVLMCAGLTFWRKNLSKYEAIGI